MEDPDNLGTGRFLKGAAKLGGEVVEIVIITMLGCLVIPGVVILGWLVFNIVKVCTM